MASLRPSKTILEKPIHNEPIPIAAQKRHSLYDPLKIIHKYNCYCCPFCSLLPEILNINEPNNTIKIKCEKHGEKDMDIHEYLERMSKYEYLIDFKLKCKIHKDYFTAYCKTCEKSLCSKCEKENDHAGHEKFPIESIKPSNNEILLIKNKINIYLQEKMELQKKIGLLEDKINFYDTLIHTLETQKPNYLLNINVKHLIYGEKVNLTEFVNDFVKKQNSNLSTGEISKKYFDDFVKNNFLNVTKNKGELNLLNHKLGDDILSQLFVNIDNGAVFRLLRLTKQIEANQKDADLLSVKNLKILNLRGNKILNLKFFSEKNLPCLQILSLNDNEISSIDLLSAISFPNLKELYLAKNKISDINVLSKLKINNLKVLWLSNNNIEDIEVLGEVHFPLLQKLGLNKNEIKEIQVFKKTKFPLLYELYIGDNNINLEEAENIEIIDKLNKKIREFYY